MKMFINFIYFFLIIFSSSCGYEDRYSNNAGFEGQICSEMLERGQIQAIDECNFDAQDPEDDYSLKFQETVSPGFIHQRVAWQAAEILSGDAKNIFTKNEVRGDIKLYCQNTEKACGISPARECTPTKKFITAGADEEDQAGLFSTVECNGFFWNRHFWKNEDGYNAGLVLLGKRYDSSVKVAIDEWRIALNNYKYGLANNAMDKIDLGYYYLGHVAHLITDAGTPAHKRDQHICGDSYEQFVNNSYNSFNAYGLNPIDYTKLTFNPSGGKDYRDDPWVKSLSQDEKYVFLLFLNMAEEADNYDADDKRCIEIGCFHYAMKHVYADFNRPPKIYILNSGKYISVDSGKVGPGMGQYAKNASYSSFSAPKSALCKPGRKILIYDKFNDWLNKWYPKAEKAIYVDFAGTGETRNYTKYKTAGGILRNGDFSISVNFIGDPEAKAIAQTLIPRTIRYVAGLYNLFYSTGATTQSWLAMSVSAVSSP